MKKLITQIIKKTFLTIIFASIFTSASFAQLAQPTAGLTSNSYSCTNSTGYKLTSTDSLNNVSITIQGYNQRFVDDVKDQVASSASVINTNRYFDLDNSGTLSGTDINFAKARLISSDSQFLYGSYIAAAGTTYSLQCFGPIGTTPAASSYAAPVVSVSPAPTASLASNSYSCTNSTGFRLRGLPYQGYSATTVSQKYTYHFYDALREASGNSVSATGNFARFDLDDNGNINVGDILIARSNLAEPRDQVYSERFLQETKDNIDQSVDANNIKYDVAGNNGGPDGAITGTDVNFIKARMPSNLITNTGGLKKFESGFTDSSSYQGYLLECYGLEGSDTASATYTRTVAPAPSCPTNYAPVCGQPAMPVCPSGRSCIQSMPAPETYSNACQMNAAGATFLSSGACVSASTVPKIKLISPSSGSVLNEGDNVEIKWSAQNLSANDSVSILIFNGPTADIKYPNTIVITNLPYSQSSYIWKVKKNDGSWGLGSLPLINKLAKFLGIEIAKAATTNNDYTLVVVAERYLNGVYQSSTASSDGASIKMGDSSSSVCTAIYKPVCGQMIPTCLAFGCKMMTPAPQTYSNRCEMEKAGATFVSDGVCGKGVPTTATTTFIATSFNPNTGALSLTWKSLVSGRVSMDVDCISGTIAFKTDKGNNPNCDKGGIWSWDNSSGDSILVTPVGNKTPVTVTFILTLMTRNTPNTWIPGETRRITVTFPAPNTPPIKNYCPLNTTFDDSECFCPLGTTMQNTNVSSCSSIVMCASRLVYSCVAIPNYETPPYIPNIPVTGTSAPAPVPCIEPTVNVGVGSRGGAVTDIQTFLNGRGYLTNTPTGYFGQATRAAVVRFQSENGINSTGFVGQLTRAQLKVKSCEPLIPVPTVTVDSISSTSIDPSISNASTVNVYVAPATTLVAPAPLITQIPVTTAVAGLSTSPATVENGNKFTAVFSAGSLNFQTQNFLKLVYKTGNKVCILTAPFVPITGRTYSLTRGSESACILGGSVGDMATIDRIEILAQ